MSWIVYKQVKCEAVLWNAYDILKNEYDKNIFNYYTNDFF